MEFNRNNDLDFFINLNSGVFMSGLNVFQVIPLEKYSYFQFSSLKQTHEYISLLRTSSFADQTIGNLDFIKNEFEGDFASIEISCISIAGSTNIQNLFPKIGKWIPILNNPNYKILLPEVINALDMKESEFNFFRDGRIMNITKYVFDTRMLKNKYIFVLPEITSTLFATDLFIEKYNNLNCRGLEFK